MNRKKHFKIAGIAITLVLLIGIPLIYLLYLGGRLGPTPPHLLFKLPAEYQGPVVLVPGQPEGIEFKPNRDDEIVLDVPTSGLMFATGAFTSYNPRFLMLDQRGIEIPIAKDTNACKRQALQDEQQLVACSQIQTKTHDAKPCPQHIAWVICSAATCQQKIDDYNEITVPKICEK